MIIEWNSWCELLGRKKWRAKDDPSNVDADSTKEAKTKSEPVSLNCGLARRAGAGNPRNRVLAGVGLRKGLGHTCVFPRSRCKRCGSIFKAIDDVTAADTTPRCNGGDECYSPPVARATRAWKPIFPHHMEPGRQRRPGLGPVASRRSPLSQARVSQALHWTRDRTLRELSWYTESLPTQCQTSQKRPSASNRAHHRKLYLRVA